MSFMALLCPCIPKVKLKNDEVDDNIGAAYHDTVVNEDSAILSSKILTVENYEAYVLPNQADGKIEDLVLVPSLRPGQDAEYMEVVIASAGAVKNENNKYLYYRTDAQSQ